MENLENRSADYQAGLKDGVILGMKQLADRLKQKAIKVSTLRKPHMYIKAVGTHEIDRIVKVMSEVQNGE